jgi:hypothetical protein
MDSECSALMKNKTWHLVPPQQGEILLTASGFIR